MKKVRIVNWLLIISMIIGDIMLVIHDLKIDKIDRIPTYIVLIPILMAPWLIRKILHYEVSEEIKLVYYIFIFLAQFLGSGINLYNKTIWFDKFTHFLSGILSGFIAILLLVEFKKNPYKNLLFHITYILGITFLIAGGWECIEFLIDKVSGSDVQHVLETGVDDTMLDMVSAIVGSVLFIIVYLYEILYNKSGIIKLFVRSLEKHSYKKKRAL